MINNTVKYSGLEIAIVGISGRFPGASCVDEYWKNIISGKESIYHFSDEELLEKGVSIDVINSKNYVKSKCLLNDKSFFDSTFFNYTSSEATLMNPQTRIFHECLWEAIEDSGNHNLMKNIPVGIFAGAGVNFEWDVYSKLGGIDQNVDEFSTVYLPKTKFMNTLASYSLDLKGPSIYVDTACSTSLVAVHLACRSLLTGDSKIAIAGGVAMHSQIGQGYDFQEGSIMSSDGHCRAFNTNSDGTMAGEGIGVIVLKKLQDAIKDGDRIYSVIKGTAINNDGHRKVGFTAPSIDGQAECIRIAHKVAKIDSETIGFIEAHGTGTKLGDPIEVLALKKVFDNGKRFSAALGSVKSNIGHLDAAAGIAGLIKAALCIYHKKIPPALYHEQPIPEIEWDGGGFYLNSELKPWVNENGMPLRAGVSSFGVGGTNAHVVLEEAIETTLTGISKEYKLATISAKTENSLKRYQKKLIDFLYEHDHIDLDDMCYTLQVGRKDFNYRQSFAFADKNELIVKLIEHDSIASAKCKDSDSAIVFMFPGQGSQYKEMGIDLYRSQILFREEMDRGLDFLFKNTNVDFKNILYSKENNSHKIHETNYTQPLLFLFEYSLAKLLMSFGISPKFMIGHSVGEYVSACISGVFSFEEALKLLIVRGELINNLPGGDMLSASINGEDAQTFVRKGLSIAAINGPKQTVFSGNNESIEALKEAFESMGIEYLKLNTSHAFHSGMLDDILVQFKEELLKVKFNDPDIPFVSNLTGDIISRELVKTPQYWVDHMRNTVLFSKGINTLMTQSSELVFLEVGPGHALSSLVKQHTHTKSFLCFNLISNHKKKESDDKFFVNNLGKLWNNGIAINWNAFYKDEKRKKISLPFYSFDKIKYPTEIDIYDLLNRKTSDRKQVTSSFNDWIYYPRWKSTSAEINHAYEPRKYILFSTNNEIISNLRSQLLSAGNEVVEVEVGSHFQSVSSTKYLIRPDNSDDFKVLFDRLEKQNFLVTDVIYCWSLLVSELVHNQFGDQNSLNMNFFALRNVLKNLQDHSKSCKRISILTSSLQKVIGNEKIFYPSSLLLSFVTVVPQEYQISCRNIDINLNEISLVDSEILTNEVLGSSEEKIVAIRYGNRWIRDFQRSAALPLKKNIIQQGGVYIVIGGLGIIGNVLTNYLLEEYNAKVIIIGRRPKEEISQKLNQYITAGNVSYFSADVSILHDFEHTVELIEAKTGKINGIINAAGNTDRSCYELIEDLTEKKSKLIFAPKIQVVENIYQLFKNKDLDFVWITSSMSSLLGGISYAAYSASNLFMDYYIESKANELNNWKCLNLPGIDFTEHNQDKSIKKTHLNREDLCQLFEWSLSINQPSLAISLEDLMERIHKKNGPEVFNNDTPFINKTERPDLKSTYIKPQSNTEIKLVNMIEDLFGVENIGVEDNFFELGGDSLKAFVLLRRIKKELNVNLALNDFFVKENIKQIASEIDDINLLLEKNNRTSRIVI